jgi:exodeoxyribonuclease VII large subunit
MSPRRARDVAPEHRAPLEEASLFEELTPAPLVPNGAGTRSRRHPSAGAADRSRRPEAISVSDLTQMTRDIVEGAFPPLWVRGEVADFKAHRSGHWYFCLRDKRAQIRCIVWRTDQQHIPAPPDDGMEILAQGQLTVYEARGDMRFVVRRMAAEGDGLWRKALERAMARLEAEGLLAPGRKRPLVRMPRRVAVVTSPDGAALRDIVAVVRRRCPSVELVVVPAKVQGDGAVRELITAIERVSRWGECDTVIVGRGGGARDDLWAFNDERVARALARCSVPTISAVGHEIDITLCDLVADVRAATPSAAAEAAVPVLADVRASLGSRLLAMRASIQRRVTDRRTRLSRTSRDLGRAMQRATERQRAHLRTVAAHLDALSPLSTLARGYVVARDADGHTLARLEQFPLGSPFDLLVQDGIVHARTERITPTDATKDSPPHPRMP